MIHEILICPHCNRKYEERAQGTTEYRSPFLHCPKCHETFVDKNSFEPALFSPQQFDNIQKEDSIRAVLYLVFSTAFFLICCFATNFKNIPFIIFSIFSAFFLLWLIIIACASTKNSSDANDKYRSNYTASLRRLCDYNYALKLSAAGFSVPSLYLDPDNALLFSIRNKLKQGDNAQAELNALYDKIKNEDKKYRLLKEKYDVDLSNIQKTNNRTCPKCQSIVAANAHHCPICGTKVIK